MKTGFGLFYSICRGSAETVCVLGATNQLPDDETGVSRVERRVEEEDGGASGGDLPGV